MSADDLRAEVAALRERLTRLEARAFPPGESSTALDRVVNERFDQLPPEARKRPIGQIKATFYFRSESSQFRGDPDANFDELLALSSDSLAKSFTGMAHPARIEIFKALLDGKKDSSTLLKAAGLNTTGQLYHHLREMEEVGLVVRHGRNLWALENLHAFAMGLLAAKALMDWRGEGKGEQ